MMEVEEQICIRLCRVDFRSIKRLAKQSKRSYQTVSADFRRHVLVDNSRLVARLCQDVAVFVHVQNRLEIGVVVDCGLHCPFEFCNVDILWQLEEDWNVVVCSPRFCRALNKYALLRLCDWIFVKHFIGLLLFLFAEPTCQCAHGCVLLQIAVVNFFAVLLGKQNCKTDGRYARKPRFIDVRRHAKRIRAEDVFEYVINVLLLRG